jgi:predicted aldo/keto reductase-like oxidoreductase
VLQFHGGWYPPEDVARILDEGVAAYLSLRDAGKIRFLGFTAEGPSGGVSQLIATGAFDVLQVRYNLLYQHTCDYVNDAGVMRDADAREMGIVTMRSLSSGIFQKLMRQVFPEALATAELDRLCLNYVLSNPLVDVAIVGMRRTSEVEANAALSDDVYARLDLVALHTRHIR